MTQHFQWIFNQLRVKGRIIFYVFLDRRKQPAETSCTQTPSVSESESFSVELKYSEKKKQSECEVVRTSQWVQLTFCHHVPVIINPSEQDQEQETEPPRKITPETPALSA